jgi:hypothetical protein
VNSLQISLTSWWECSSLTRLTESRWRKLNPILG